MQRLKACRASASHRAVRGGQNTGMNDSDQPIIGKSVEEIESESGNRVNSPVEGEGRRDSTNTVLVPAVNPPGTGVTSAGVVGRLPGVIGTGLTEDRAGTEDGRGGKKSDGE